MPLLLKKFTGVINAAWKSALKEYFVHHELWQVFGSGDMRNLKCRRFI